MSPNPQETRDLVAFTEEILHGKLHFLCSVFCTLLLDLRSEGPDEINSLRLPVYLIVGLFGVFLRNRSYEFANFLHEVRVSSNLNCGGPQFFEKNLVLRF